MRIVDIRPELPATVPIADVADHLGLDAEALRMHTWFLGQRNIAIASCALEEMLVRPACGVMDGRDPLRLTHVLYCHTVPHVAPPSLALMERIRRAVGAKQATSIALSQQNCTTPLYALRLARALLDQQPDDTQILLLAGERSFPAATRVIPGTTVMGEATVAVLLGADTEPGDRVVEVRHRTVGRYYLATDLPADLRAEYDAAYPALLGNLIDETVAAAGLAPGDVAAVLPHNVNRYSWRAVMAHSALDFSLVYLDNIAALGHCFGADPFINLASAKAAGIVGEGDFVVMATAGLGATFGAAVVQIGGETR